MASRRVDVVISGGGPAGLSAALVLGRCRRNTVLFDDGNYRNAPAQHMRGFLTRDRTSPRELRQLAHPDVERYPSVTIIPETIVDARRPGDSFSVITKAGDEYECSALLLATGFRDTQPTVAGARELHGDLVVPCPYCDGWEVRDQPLAAYSYPDERGARYALLLAQWTDDVVTTRKGETSVPGLFVAGDASRDVLQAIVAAGEGAAAAVTINEYLCRKESYAEPPT